MAEQDGEVPGEKMRRRKGPRPQPVLNLDATEIEPVPAPGSTAAPEVEPEAATAPIADVEPEAVAVSPPDGPAEEQPAFQRRDVPPASAADDFADDTRSSLGALLAAGIAGAAIAISTLILLVALELIPLGVGDPALGSRVADLEAQLEEQRAAPSPASEAAAAAYDDTDLRGRVETLSQRLSELAARPAASAAPDPALQQRLDEVSARLDTVAQAAESRTSADAFNQLAARVDDLTEQAAQARAPDPAVQNAIASAKRSSALAAVASLESALSRGAPYSAALGVVREQVEGADLGSLQANAESGIAPAAALAEALSKKLEDAPQPTSQATGLMDRLAEGARGLVRVRPVDGSVPEAKTDDPWSARTAVSVRLGQGDYAGALADWDKLDDAAKKATAAEAEALKSRLTADAALDALRAQALRAGAEP